MKAHFDMMAAYNAWANARLYDAAHALPDEEYRRDLGAAFKSIHGTLNHLVVTDVIWLSRFRDLPNPPWPLDHVPHDDPRELRARRDALDRDIIGFVGALTDVRLEGEFEYMTVFNPRRFRQALAPALAHFFNHQTHHRGQCHAMLTRLTGHAPALDLIMFQRGQR
jgi:uncharacterized damage-inducible protein DinB